MKKAIQAVSLLCLLLVSTMTVNAANIESTHTSLASIDVNITINEIDLDLQEQTKIVDQQVYIPIRTLAEIFEAEEILWNRVTNEAIILVNGYVVIADSNANTVTVNNEAQDYDLDIILKEGNTYVPLRFFSDLFGAKEIHWDHEKNAVVINDPNITVQDRFILTEPVEEIEEKNYTDEDVEWLSKIVQAEAGYEPYQGKLAVANVVINRKNSSIFPNTIKEVIFDTRYGVQFTPTVNGTINNTPNEESVQAAIEALEGHNNIGEALYFTPSMNSWPGRNRTFYKQIHGHYFFL
ncbi:N-acetylmuramoyl-L-alanine amidase [Natranaerovirga hydrolytica]|uniref:N-acetylmuramoyl-L-alanine amidase n=1 Tax=Natranaerovirga hydrolytica TaxID=680378 RepID=A0A4R1N420_9FIRM|nr:cell wall hydrolase [Natranaerovirga hydrolytica]TCK98824.1 N-acetylmuramoyl-L-alanine amidase [Natranaerovirga hydrolytica]